VCDARKMKTWSGKKKQQELAGRTIPKSAAPPHFASRCSNKEPPNKKPKASQRGCSRLKEAPSKGLSLHKAGGSKRALGENVRSTFGAGRSGFPQTPQGEKKRSRPAV